MIGIKGVDDYLAAEIDVKKLREQIQELKLRRFIRDVAGGYEKAIEVVEVLSASGTPIEGILIILKNNLEGLRKELKQ